MVKCLCNVKAKAGSALANKGCEFMDPNLEKSGMG